MTGNVLYFLISVFGLSLIAVFVIGKVYIKNIVPVKTVHAGEGGMHTFMGDSVVMQLSPFEYFYHDGKKINPKKYEVRVAVGNCMAARGIVHGDLLFIQKFKKGEDKQIAAGDILFIRKQKDGDTFHKIREFKKFDEEGKALTFYYLDKNGTARDSSSPHDLNDIEGTVKMKFKLG